MKVVKFIVICSLSMLITSNSLAQLWLNSKCQDTISTLVNIKNTLQSKNNELDGKVKAVEAKLQNEVEISKVDKFLNIVDSTIFTSNFQNFDVNKISPRSRNFYLLIENIHDLNDLLATKGDLLTQIEHLKNNLEKASQKIIEIDSSNEYEYLSENQKSYIKKLVDYYNELSNTINPQGK